MMQNRVWFLKLVPLFVLIIFVNFMWLGKAADVKDKLTPGLLQLTATVAAHTGLANELPMFAAMVHTWSRTCVCWPAGLRDCWPSRARTHACLLRTQIQVWTKADWLCFLAYALAHTCFMRLALNLA